MYCIHMFSNSWKIITNLLVLHFFIWHIPKILNSTQIPMQFVGEQHPLTFQFLCFHPDVYLFVKSLCQSMLPGLDSLAVGLPGSLSRKIWQLFTSLHISSVSCLFCSKSQSAYVGYTTGSGFLEVLVWRPNHIQQKL